MSLGELFFTMYLMDCMIQRRGETGGGGNYYFVSSQGKERGLNVLASSPPNSPEKFFLMGKNYNIFIEKYIFFTK